MKKYLFALLSFFFVSVFAFAQKPKSGSYTYSVAYAEWGGKSLGSTCTVKIKGDSIFIIHDGNKSMTGNKGDTLDHGIIMKHTKTGNWIIGRNAKDKDAKEIGGCSDGPSIIDFKRKKWWSC